MMLINLIMLSMPLTFACDQHGLSGFMPKNNLKIYKEDKDTNGMTKEKFESIIKRVYDAYAPIVAVKNATLQMINNWDDPTVNAYADRDGDGNTWHVSMFGGMARHPLITDDGFMMVVCHETGHHVGGAPKYSYGNEWAAAEGQADYFAALKCMKRVLEKDDNISLMQKIIVDDFATKQCQTVYKNESEIALCKRIAMAGKTLATLLGSLQDAGKMAFNTPDKSKVKKTDSDHPWPQCRLDTFFQGALCDKSYTEDVSETSTVPGTCIKRDGFLLGPRPLCWYRPSDKEI
jgi:hypothetical protein